MTKGRKIGISLAFVLIFMFVCSCVIPLYANNNGNVASAAPVITDTASTWENPYNGNYYKSIENSNNTGTAFRSELANLITSTHKNLTTYAGLADIYGTSDADPNKPGNIIWFYTGTSVPFSGFGGNVGDTNREHVWAKHGGKTIDEKSLAGSDAHHLRPTETNINSIRGEDDFAEVPQTTSNRVAQAQKYEYGNANDLDSWVYHQGGFFYPAAGFRGQVARILFYVQVRWGDYYGLSFVDGAGSTKTIGKISDLLKWHLEEPPTEAEIRRNEVVFGYQKNRNPFIDHPEYAERIFCNDGNNYNNALKNVVSQYGSYLNGNGGGGTGGGGTDTPTLTGLTLSPSTLNLAVGATQTVTVTAIPSTADSSVTWSSNNTSVATVSNTGVVTAVGKGEAKITATSTLNTSISKSLTVTVVEQADMEGVFTAAMAALSNATTLEGRYEAIAAAVSAYKQMSQSDQTAHNADKATLEQAISAYNEEISVINEQFQEATGVAAQAIAKTVSMSFLALVLIVIRRVVGR